MRPSSFREIGLAAALICGAAVAGACHHRAASATASATVSTDPPSVGADSAEGVVKVVGADAMQRTVLTTDDGRTLALEDGDSLATVAGLRVLVRGTRSARGLRVADFRVTAAHGVAATDGTLAMEDANLILVTADGRRLPVSVPTTGLRALVGRRVWIAGPLDRAAVSYGLIQ